MLIPTTVSPSVIYRLSKEVISYAVRMTLARARQDPDWAPGKTIREEWWNEEAEMEFAVAVNYHPDGEWALVGDPFEVDEGGPDDDTISTSI
jgi:hypothetical protein